MSRDLKLSRRNSGKNLKFEEIENLPVNVNLREPSIGRVSIDSHSRPPLNTIQDPPQNPSKSDYESGLKSSKLFRTPTKPKVRNLESGMALKTPEKQGGLNRNRYGWGFEPRDEVRIGNGNTPKLSKSIPRCLQEPNSTHSTPTKSVGKPPNLGFFNGGSSRPPVNGGVRTGNFAALSKGIPVAFNTCTTVNTVEVPHYDLREDPSFWMDHNVQVLIRIRPLNGMEIGSQGYNRCLKQESAQTLTWISQPETRFTFDHVACETIDQETLFKMVGQPMVENCLSGYNSCMFAYGQTGSGKTHTMLGEINDLETKPSPNRGMTPRIFEFLFSRIIVEEKCRMDERLKYTCKCSFLEIYNEQITDLLDPSSTNLQLREDVKKGVYVENLTEYEVHSVGDILKLLSQGSANRRVAATNMNRESSRSHSVFTCVIESRWEKDSTSNLRFARLNLVDLAGSERQKTSGAEGERLKEAANINKSLSTLGHVIMVLVDGANARTRHVPYRDSRLTFLLQDSLGGNSKTMIIANVSPSTGSAVETLNTLKFAQRAKLIQNNAVINEDASGDVVALQHQIRLLKEELAILKRQNTSRSLTFSSKDENCSNASSYGDEDEDKRVSCNQLKSLESSLNGALRREKSTENCIKQLEAEIEQLNCLVRQREEENRCTKMMLKFREAKIQKMESVFSGLISADSYLIEENNTLTEEIKILRAKVDKNPEVTRFAVDNIRLQEQLKRFQDFYEEGEREMLLAEVSELRDQLALLLDEHNDMNLRTEKEAAKDKNEISSLQSELLKSQEELEKCRDNLNSCIDENTKLCREISDLNALLERQKSSLNDQVGGVEVMKESISESSSAEDENDEFFKKYPEEVVGLQLELEFLKTIFKEERYENNLKEKEIQQELTLLREMYEEKDRNFNGLSEEFDFLTRKIEEVLAVGHNALDDASNFIGHGKQTRVCENLQVIARKISEKELRIDELNTCLEDAKVRGNEMETMLRLLKGATLVLSEAHQKDCIKKDEEIDKILSELKEKNSIINLMEEQRKQYEAELMDAKINAAHQEMESCCYLDKFVEIQDSIQEANLMINKLMTENEAMKMEINRQNQEISDKEERLRCLEASKSINLENEKIHMSTVLEKLKEQIITSYVDMQLKDCILLEKDAEVGLLLKEKELFEVQLMDVIKNTTQHALESCCYLDKFEETQHKINEADCMINNLVNTNEAVKTEINELKRKEINFIKAREILEDSYSALEKQINEKDEKLRCLEEKLVIDLSAKDIELFMMSSTLEQVAAENNDLEKDKVSMSEVFEKLKEDIIICNVDLHFKDLILLEQELKSKDETEELEACFESLESEHCENIVRSLVIEARLTENAEDAIKAKRLAEVDLAEIKKAMKIIELKTAFDGNNLIESLKDELESVTCERDDLHVEFNKAKELYELELTEAMINASQQAVKSSCYLAKFVETQNKIKEADFIINNLLTDLSAKETELCMMSSHLEINISKVFEKLKEDIIISHVDMHFKDLILLEVDAELRLHKEDNETLAARINIQKDKVAEMEGFCEALECELYENVVKSSVLECWSIENALNVKRSIVQLTHFQERYEIQLKESNIKLQEAVLMISKLGTENEAIKTEISHQNQVINAEEIELFIILSRLEQAASDYNDLEKEKTNAYSVLEKFKQERIISYVDQHFKDLLLLENDAEIAGFQMACETSKRYDQEKLKLYEKSVEELESTVNLLENQVDLVKGEAESQRLKNEELKEEVERTQQQKQLLVTENETFKEENDMLKARNEENSGKLRETQAIVARVREGLANLRARKQLHEKETDKSTDIIVHGLTKYEGRRNVIM
ncbi:kinesin-like protein KIN-12C [Bidens hawaiensis]|uniref:kinesin-like protein KIN-12C n=1 Tax=Bidens hawaiensis TaxID=980011 RepID=UPI004048FD5E